MVQGSGHLATERPFFYTMRLNPLLQKLDDILRIKFNNNLKKFGVNYPTGRQLLSLLCLFENFNKPVSQDKITRWFKENTEYDYNKQARHLARVQGWYIKSGNRRSSEMKNDKNMKYNELKLYSIKKPNPIWLKNKKFNKRTKLLSNLDWKRTLDLFFERGCAVCGRKVVGGQKLINFDKGHVSRKKPEEKGNIVPMCTPCNNWAQAKDLDFYDDGDLVYRPVIKKL